MCGIGVDMANEIICHFQYFEEAAVKWIQGWVLACSAQKCRESSLQPILRTDTKIQATTQNVRHKVEGKV